MKSLFDNRFDFALKMINFRLIIVEKDKNYAFYEFSLTTQNINIKKKKNVTLTFD